MRGKATLHGAVRGGTWRRPPGTIYFVGTHRGDEPQMVKIGWTAGEVEKRVRALQVCSPVELVLLASIPEKDIQDEHRLHGALEPWCKRGEWFELTRDLVETIASSDFTEAVLALEDAGGP